MRVILLIALLIGSVSGGYRETWQIRSANGWGFQQVSYHSGEYAENALRSFRKTYGYDYAILSLCRVEFTRCLPRGGK